MHSEMLIAQAELPPRWFLIIIGLIFSLNLPIVVRFCLNQFQKYFPRTTILEHTRGLRYHRGVLVGQLEPGEYRFYTATNHILIFDIREQAIQVAGQEVLTADALGFKVSLHGTYRVVDPVKANMVAYSYYAALYADIQTACRSVLEKMTCEEILAGRNQIGTEIYELARAEAAKYGLELIKISVRDFMLPSPLKAIYTKVAEAKQEGLAALERARGETAALRSLANASRLMATNPGLGILRTLQTLEKSTGNSIILFPHEVAGRFTETLQKSSDIEMKSPKGEPPE
jgi:hypothetical protein